jgi:hypothetical protein
MVGVRLSPGRADTVGVRVSDAENTTVRGGGGRWARRRVGEGAKPHLQGAEQHHDDHDRQAHEPLHTSCEPPDRLRSPRAGRVGDHVTHGLSRGRRPRTRALLPQDLRQIEAKCPGARHRSGAPRAGGTPRRPPRGHAPHRPRALPPRRSHALLAAAALAFFHRAPLHALRVAAARASFHHLPPRTPAGRDPRVPPRRRSPRPGWPLPSRSSAASLSRTPCGRCPRVLPPRRPRAPCGRSTRGPPPRRALRKAAVPFATPIRVAARSVRAPLSSRAPCARPRRRHGTRRMRRVGPRLAGSVRPSRTSVSATERVDCASAAARSAVTRSGRERPEPC